MAEKKRIEWIDVAKCVGIILMVVGHFLMPQDEYIRALIYSFHIPLFFILSFMTTSLSHSKEMFYKKTKKRFLHLIIPYVVSFLVVLIAKIITNNSLFFSAAFWKESIVSFVGYVYVGFNAAGPLWFLLALFIGQTLFDLSHLLAKDDTHLFVISLFLTTIGVIMGLKGCYLPLTLDMVLSSFMFFFLGYKLKIFDFNKHLWLILGLSFVIWISTFFMTYPVHYLWTYYELWMRRYPLYPICHICAFTGSLFTMSICVLICRIPFIHKPIAYLGRNSLILLCVHFFSNSILAKYVKFPTNLIYLPSIVRILVGLAISLVLIFAIDFIKKCKNNRKNA